MKAILNRFGEGSTYAGAAGICLALAVGGDIFGLPSVVVTVLIMAALVLGAIAIGVPDKIRKALD